MGIGIQPGRDAVVEGYIVLTTDGALRIRKGYAWDGPSWPALDTLTFMRGSLVHDALYQLMRVEQLHRRHRDEADQLLRAMCLADGMNPVRAWGAYQVVRLVGGRSARPAARKRRVQAPRACQTGPVGRSAADPTDEVR